ncbi:flagellar hook capping protein [Desulfitobacterium hafniense DCB-2]|uniref:Flagellar basal-body rod modification protein FlgD n=2 Tax=Desulfitobacterium TaxID=36853 RepID=A0A1M7UDT7_9FIRM|nr:MULTISPECIES: flagellar hook capping FlgD N-terminal domain-containing protein [Desulfitobacterium]ACL22134.1 flagellar hook capping protein [Desulfitobacterium hafniense DCB-2]SHN81094.1 flagellar basal-body rod modification protein FlgD [Desulfitobacterium chlororespirans DSM 11544]
MGNTVDTNYSKYSSTSESKQSSAVSDATKEVLGKDDFLKLLVAELTNQDPLSPMDNKDMITQMAQFSSLEQMNNMSKSMENLVGAFGALFQNSLLSQGAALIGKHVEGANIDGSGFVNGIVESVQWLNGNPQLVLVLEDGSKAAVDMSDITYVADPKEPDPDPDPVPEDDTSEDDIPKDDIPED